MQFMTKKQIIKKVIEKLGDEYTVEKVQQILKESDVSVSPVYIYSVKREMDGKPPYDCRNLFRINEKMRTKTDIISEIQSKNPEITIDEMIVELSNLGIVGNKLHVRRIMSHNRKNIAA